MEQALFDQFCRPVVRLWNRALGGDVFTLDLAKTMAVSAGLLVAIMLGEFVAGAFVFAGIGLSYLYFLPIWFSARRGGRVAGFLTSFLTATIWAATHRAGSPFGAWLVALGVLTLVMMVFETLERRIDVVNRKASVDALTGLFNRSAFTSLAKSVLAEGEKTRNYGVLLLIDCNDFKQINDVHGHAMGDEALKMLGRTLRDCSQGDDVIGRLGGDEFVILLAESDMVGANQYLNRVNGVLARSGSGLPFTVSISAGSALQGVHGRTLDALMEQADAAMYRNKQRRKMAVVTEPSTNRTGLLS